MENNFKIRDNMLDVVNLLKKEKKKHLLILFDDLTLQDIMEAKDSNVEIATNGTAGATAGALYDLYEDSVEFREICRYLVQTDKIQEIK